MAKLFTVVAWLLLALPGAAAEVLVVCPTEFRPALVEWEAHRREQGHSVTVVEPRGDAGELKAAIRRVAGARRLDYVVLVGNAPVAASESSGSERCVIHTNYVAATINTRWGSEPLIASDTPYADVDDDGLPDVAIGRIAADSREELAAVVRKIIRYETAESGAGDRCLNVVSGDGGFGVLADALIESAARLVFQQAVPSGYELQHTPVKAAQLRDSSSSDVRLRVREQISGGGLAWVYLGHGLPMQLDRVRAGDGNQPLLSMDDVALLRCGARSPLAVLVACYTGALDAPQGCLAQRLSVAEAGPIAVIAATRVTMPYGNTVFGYELLRACFAEETETLGEILLQAQRRTLREGGDDPLRASLDAMCQGLSPPPIDLAAERREHVLMYHLLGDPLLRVRTARVDVGASVGRLQR